MYTQEKIIEKIIEIRKEIGHDPVKPEIKKIHYNNNELSIITPDRPEKSIIIGKGGWVVGKLKEELKLDSIHVISYTDLILKEYQLELSIKHITDIIKEKQIPEEYIPLFEKIKELLTIKHDKIYDNKIIETYVEENINKTTQENTKAIIALSGGVDSSFSLLLAKSIGLDTTAMTIDPGTIILPKQFRQNIDNLTSKINVPHKYIKTDLTETIKESLKGKIHPCGRCSKTIHNAINKEARKENIKLIIFGDLLSTGSQSITIKEDEIRINLPALFRMEKTEIKNIVTKYEVKKIKGYGCPLLVQVHKNYPQYKAFSIQRILRETRAGILEPGEALELIKTI